MGKIIFSNIFRFVLLLVFQVLVFSKINLFGFINPYPYILFILLFPVWGNKNILLLTSFILGFSIDLFSNSGGVHAMASLFIAYIRPSFLTLTFGNSIENQTFEITKKFTTSVLIYIVSLVLIHHFILFLIEIFSFTYFLDILIRTISSTLFTLLLCVIVFLFLKPQRK